MTKNEELYVKDSLEDLKAGRFAVSDSGESAEKLVERLKNGEIIKIPDCKTCDGDHPCYIEDETPGAECGACLWVCPAIRKKKKEGKP